LLVFQVAVDSDGQRWDAADFLFIPEAGNEPRTVTFSVSDLNFPQHYSMAIIGVQESDSGVYTARALGEYNGLEGTYVVGETWGCR
jgi:hypothetical protein